jgi:hypothetical protein
MLRKSQRPSSLTSWQVQQLKRNSLSLRKFNCEARRELRRIGSTGRTRTQYCDAGDLLGSIATRMISALRFRHEILKAEQPQEPFCLNVRFVEPCAQHVYRFQSRQPGRHDDEAQREALILQPAHQADIASLLVLTNSIEERVSRCSMLRGASLNEFFEGINRLRLAVLQQQQYLLATAPKLMLFKLNIVFGARSCPDCLKSKEIDGTMEGATDKSDETFTEGSLAKH